MLDVVCLLITLFTIAVFGTIILSWFPMPPGSALSSVYSFLRQITEPVLGPVRRALPMPRLGGMAIDLSPIVVLIGLQVLQAIICR